MTQVRAAALTTLVITALTVVGCGSESSDGAETQRAAEVQQARERAREHAVQRRAEARRESRVRARQAKARQARLIAVREERAEQRKAETEEAAAIIAEEEAAAEEESSECDPSYAGACLDRFASDYDCEGGSGDGPLYTGTVSVVGEDHYGLDANSNGVGCE